MSLLVVGAHAMDAEIMAGALAARTARRGERVVLLHLTRGERGHPVLDAGRFAAQLEVEMKAAAAVLGVEQRWSGLAAPLAEGREVEGAIALVLDEIEPDLVVTHWNGSWHPSHRRAHHAVLAAVERRGGVPVLYAENCEDLDGFRADFLVPVTEVYQTWLEALDCYELFRRSVPGSGCEAAIPYWAYYTAAAAVRGLHAGVERAVALMRGPGPPAPARLGLGDA